MRLFEVCRTESCQAKVELRPQDHRRRDKYHRGRCAGCGAEYRWAVGKLEATKPALQTPRPGADAVIDLRTEPGQDQPAPREHGHLDTATAR